MIERLVKRFNVTATPVHSPMLASTTLVPMDHADSKPDATEFRSIAGTINFIANSTRPDCAYVAKELCRNLSNPSNADMRAAKRAAQYLYTTRYDGFTFDRRCSNQPTGYADADFANQLSNRRSTTGRIVMLYVSAIVWSLRQQKTVTLSTAEAKYYALRDSGRDLVWVWQLMNV